MRCLLAVDFHFDVVVHVVGGVAVTVEANVLCLGAFGIDQLAVACVDVRLVGAFALLGRVVVVVVEASVVTPVANSGSFETCTMTSW